MHELSILLREMMDMEHSLISSSSGVLGKEPCQSIFSKIFIKKILKRAFFNYLTKIKFKGKTI
jgi:hypothetical protein